MTFYIVTAWQGTTVVAMHIECDRMVADWRCARLSEDAAATSPKEVTHFTIEGPWEEGEDLSSEDRVFCTMYAD